MRIAHSRQLFSDWNAPWVTSTLCTMNICQHKCEAIKALNWGAIDWDHCCHYLHNCWHFTSQLIIQKINKVSDTRWHEISYDTFLIHKALIFRSKIASATAKFRSELVHWGASNTNTILGPLKPMHCARLFSRLLSSRWLSATKDYTEYSKSVV